jgi:uncharacterized protein
MFRVLAVVLMFLMPALASGAAYAQQQTAGPLMGSEASPELPTGANPTNDATVTAPAEPSEEYRILVIGDSIAGGLGAGMSRMVETDPSIQILNRFNEVSGLARTELYDWPSAVAKIAVSNPVNAVVVLVGINDRQPIRDSDNRLAFRTPEWQKAYESNVDRLATAVKSSGAALYWISIPPMADARLEADMRFLSEIHRARVAAIGGHFVDVRSFFLAPDGSFAERGPDETGVERKLRARDGITFMKQGNSRFGQLVLGAIKTIESKTAPEAPPAVASAPDQKPADNSATKGAEAPAAPMMGQAGLDGEDVTFRAEASLVKPASEFKTPVKKTELVPTNSVLPTRLAAKPGTLAAKLLLEGLSPAAPAGRFDDDTVPPLLQ